MMQPPPPARAVGSIATASSKAVVLSLYRMMLRWLNQPVVKETKFLAGELPPELLALGLTRKQLTNREGLRDAIVSTFRSRAALAGREVSHALDLGFKGLQYLGGLTVVLQRAQERRRENRDRGSLRFKIGDVVRHKIYSYRGVVLGWDKRPTIDVSEWDGVLQTVSGADQPFYHIAPDSHDIAHFLGSSQGGPVRRRLMYVAQENLGEVNMLERRIHSDVISSACEMYDPVTGRFVLQELAYQYPADVEHSKQHHPKNLRLSAEHAKLVDASRRVEAQVQLLAQRLLDDLQRHFGVLERFGEPPVRDIIALLERMRATTAAEAAPTLAAAATGAPASASSSSSKRAIASGAGHKLQQVEGGYGALGLLRDLFVMVEDYVGSRAGSKEREGLAFQLGQVVRHAELGYRSVIVGFERFPRIPLPSDPPSLTPHHPHYRVIVIQDDPDAPSTPLVVLPQQALEPTSAEESASVVSPLIPQFFTHFDPARSCFAPNAASRFKFLLPEDGAGPAGPSSSSAAQQWRIVERVFNVLLKFLDHVRRTKHGKHGHAHGLKGDLLLMLQQAPRKEDAEVVENVCWLFFLAHPSERVRTLMEDGVQLMMRSKYDEAIARFSEVLDQDPAFAEGYNKRGTAHFLAGRHHNSALDVVQTLAREPAHFGALIGKGLVEFEQGRKVHAIKSFRAALRVHPWSTNVGTTLHHCRKLLEGEEVAVEV